MPISASPDDTKKVQKIVGLQIKDKFVFVFVFIYAHEGVVTQTNLPPTNFASQPPGS